MSTNTFEVALSVDVVLLGLIAGKLHVALLQRPSVEGEPFPGKLALPGGTVDKVGDEDTDVTVMRILAQKARVQPRYFEQLRAFAGAKRDPRGWSAALAHVALVDPETVESGSPLSWVPAEGISGLAFDHDAIVAAAVARVKNKSSYSTLPLYLMPEEFTLPELQAVYEELLGSVRNKKTFRRQIEEMGVLVPLNRMKKGKGRPSMLYKVRGRGDLVMLPGMLNDSPERD